MVFFNGMVDGFLAVENTMTFFSVWVSRSSGGRSLGVWWLFTLVQIWSGFERIGHSDTKSMQNI